MKKLLFLAAFLGFATQAKAGILLEPYAGYEMESGTATYTAALGGGTGTSSGSAISAGLRLGYHAMGGFWVAADGQFGFSGKETYSPNSGDDTYTRQQIYADFGYDWPRIFRIWAGYAVSNQMVMTPDAGGPDTTYTGGTAWKVGIGFRLMPKLTLGIEYHANTFSKFKNSGVSPDEQNVSDYYDTFTDNATLVTLSFPFML